MHYLVTGGAGFIGSNLIRDLLQRQKDISISCIDNFDPFYSKEVKQLNISDFWSDANFRFLDLDVALSQPKQLSKQITEPIDTIVHFAAKAGVRPSILNPVAYQETNVLGLQHLLDFAKEKNIQQFVFASSSSVYGVNDHFPWKEDERLLPISPYAMTKLAGEMLGHVYSKLFNIRFIALRFFTVYGPAQRPDLAIHKFTKAMLKDEPITMYGDGNTSRDYTYIDDIMQAVVAATKYRESNFEIINVGNNYSVSLQGLIGSLEKIIGKKATIERLPEQPGDVPKTFADISRAKRLLDYEPRIKLAEGLQRFYEWFMKHQTLLLK